MDNVFYQSKAKNIPIEAQTDAAMSRKAIKGGERARSFPYAPMPICRKWNSVEGCNLPMCRYRHCCYKCNAKSHKAIHCQNQRDHLNDKAPPFSAGPRLTILSHFLNMHTTTIKYLSSIHAVISNNQQLTI